MEKVNACVEKIKDAFKELILASESETELLGSCMIVAKQLDRAFEDAYDEAEKERKTNDS